jgi:hypothetical protein
MSIQQRFPFILLEGLDAKPLLVFIFRAAK